MPAALDRLPLRELRAALEFDPEDLDGDAAWALRDFLDRIGGLENALLAVKVLEEIETVDENGH